MKYEKLLILGLAAIISTNALAIGNNSDQTYENLTQQVHALQYNNIIPKIDVNYIIKPNQEINKTRVQAEALLHIANENCSVHIDVTPDMKISHSGTTENREYLKEVTGSSNQLQEEIRTSYITYHETAHCKMYEIKDPFKANNKNVEQTLNQFFQFSGSSYGSEKGDTGLYYILHENFADTFAYIQLIKNHGVGENVLSTMQKIQIERTDAANTYNKNGLIAHNTDFALKEVLKEDTIKKIMATESQEDLQEIALQIANKGMWQSLKTHGVSDQFANVESLESGAKFLLSGLLYKSIELKDGSEKNVNLHLENNVLQTVALEVKADLSTKFDLNSIKTEEQMTDFYKKNIDVINQAIIEKVDQKLVQSLEKGIDVFSSVSDYLSTITPGSKMSLEELKISGTESVKNIEKLSYKLSMESALKNVNSIRSSSMPSVNKVHFKYTQ